MKRKILMVLTVSVLISALAGCSFGKKEENASVGSSNVQTPAQSVVSEDEMTKITQSEISALGNNEFYVVNGTGSDITNIYAALMGAGEWGTNLISMPLKTGEKIKVSISDFNPEEMYDICVVDSNSNTTEYYSFDVRSTVQIVFYDNAQCDVITV